MTATTRADTCCGSAWQVFSAAVNAIRESKRIAYVDRLRGLAVLGMFYVHSGYAWLLPETRDASTYGAVLNQVSGMVAPVFMFLAGIAVTILAGRGRGRGVDERRLKRRVVRRGVQILGIGYGLNIAFVILQGFSADWTRMLRVDILQCIGFSLVVLPWLCWPKRRYNWPALAACLVFVFAAQLTWRLPLAEWLPDGIAGYLTREVSHSRFPLFPYAGWVALGMFIGPLWSSATVNIQVERRFWLGLVASALVAFVSWQLLAWAHVQLGLDRIGLNGKAPVTTVHFFMFKIGIVFLLFTAARLTSPIFDRFTAGPLTMLGKTSMFAYCVHLVAIYHLFGSYWLGGLNAGEQTLAAVLLSVIMFLLGWLWRRRSPKIWLPTLRRATARWAR